VIFCLFIGSVPGADALQSAKWLGNPLVVSQLFQSLGGREDAPVISTLTFSGAGLAALPVDKILAKEYIDFADLSPAKSKPTLKPG